MICRLLFSTDQIVNSDARWLLPLLKPIEECVDFHIVCRRSRGLTLHTMIKVAIGEVLCYLIDHRVFGVATGNFAASMSEPQQWFQELD